MLFLDFDNDVSEVNLINSLQFMIMTAQKEMLDEAAEEYQNTLGQWISKTWQVSKTY